jgi:hypothetical protein
MKDSRRPYPDGIGFDEAWFQRQRADAAERAIRRLADQDATLSVQGGNVIVDMDVTLTDEERQAIQWAADTLCVGWNDLKPDGRDRSRTAADTLHRMLERLR